MGQMRVFIASADESLRLALLMLLDPEPDMTVVGLSDRVPGLLAQLGGAEPDVLLFDWELSVRSMGSLLDDIHSLPCRPQIIVLSTRPKVKEAIKATGVNLFISKDSPPDELLPMLNGIKLSRNRLNYKET